MAAVEKQKEMLKKKDEELIITDMQASGKYLEIEYFGDKQIIIIN